MSNLDNTKITREQIENRAYELYLKRGGVNGSDQDDWFAAERELRAAQDAAANSQGWSVPLSGRPVPGRQAVASKSEVEPRKIATMGERS